LGENNLDISDKFCHVCKNKNDREALICVHCGASLDTFFPESATTRTTDVPVTITGKSAAWLYDETVVPTGSIAIYVEGASKPVFSCSDDEFVIGRKVDDSSEALLDLSGLGGYHLGLSRRHAKIRRKGNGYEITDLSSSNGTWLNDERLTPNRPYPLANGSQLRLARMRLFIVFRPTLEPKPKT
jgi:pSer/pThr/pTyr-binding forkhead associated (FHA) protein